MTMLLADWRSEACSITQADGRRVSGSAPARARSHSCGGCGARACPGCRCRESPPAPAGRYSATSSGSDRPPNRALRTRADSRPMIRPMALATRMMMAALGRTGCTAASRMRTLPTLPARISELLGIVQQRGVQLGVHAHVAHQPHHVLFQVGQLLDVVADAVHVAGQRGDLPVDGRCWGEWARSVIRSWRLARSSITLVCASTDCARISGFLAQVDGAALVAQGVVLGLGRVQVLLHLGAAAPGSSTTSRPAPPSGSRSAARTPRRSRSTRRWSARDRCLPA